MKKLNKEQLKAYHDLSDKLHEAYDRLAAPIARFNEAVARAHAELQQQPEVNALNETIGEVNSFMETIHGEQQDFYDERSEGWQDGDAGSAYSDWMGAWEMEIEGIEFEDPYVMEMPYFDALESFEGIDTEVP